MVASDRGMKWNESCAVFLHKDGHPRLRHSFRLVTMFSFQKQTLDESSKNWSCFSEFPILLVKHHPSIARYSHVVGYIKLKKISYIYIYNHMYVYVYIYIYPPQKKMLQLHVPRKIHATQDSKGSTSVQRATLRPCVKSFWSAPALGALEMALEVLAGS